jgi:hypothetical protein
MRKNILYQRDMHYILISINFNVSLVVCLKNQLELLKYTLNLMDYLKTSGNLVIYSRDLEVIFYKIAISIS